ISSRQTQIRAFQPVNLTHGWRFIYALCTLGEKQYTVHKQFLTSYCGGETKSLIKNFKITV
ncbi:MAG: hypothetical protein ACRDEA_11310, partial [Microcystaceae cyanobacterium]